MSWVFYLLWFSSRTSLELIFVMETGAWYLGLSVHTPNVRSFLEQTSGWIWCYWSWFGSLTAKENTPALPLSMLGMSTDHVATQWWNLEGSGNQAALHRAHSASQWDCSGRLHIPEHVFDLQPYCPLSLLLLLLESSLDCPVLAWVGTLVFPLWKQPRHFRLRSDDIVTPSQILLLLCMVSLTISLRSITHSFDTYLTSTFPMPASSIIHPDSMLTISCRQNWEQLAFCWHVNTLISK